MRLVWTVMFALASGAAFAASPEDDYIAARDKAIAAIAALNTANAPVETLDAADAKARTDLEGRLSTLLGPLAVKDFPPNGTINLESLSDSDVGYGMLDGLRYANSDEGPSLVATTRGLLDRWLKARSAETDPGLKLPTSVDEALKLDAFYTQAINSDAAFMGTLDFPLKKPEGADVAMARLGGWTQDVGPIQEQQVVVTLVKGNSVMIASAPATPLFPRSRLVRPCGHPPMKPPRNWPPRRPRRTTSKCMIPPMPPGKKATTTIANAWAKSCRRMPPSPRCLPRRRRLPTIWRVNKARGEQTRRKRIGFRIRYATPFRAPAPPLACLPAGR
ncbi:hypothetical protein ACVDG5_014605 [Mesorhizobium sp. ORM6]